MPEASDNLSDELFALLGDTHETAAVTLFLQLLRESPSLRNWLGTAFLEPHTRSRLTAYLRGEEHHASRGRYLLAWFARASDARELFTATLARDHKPASVSTYGGLTRAQVVRLVRRYQSGGANGVNLLPFLLVHAWRQSPDRACPSAALLLMGGMVLQEMFSGTPSSLQLMRHFAKAVEFFHGQPHGSITRKHFGYVNWWKLSVLHYMLNHPKPRYCTRDFAKHLAAQKISVDPKDLRRFCQKHGIMRDTRPGRPKVMT
ncbi:hypothetical protein M2447_001136 [Ereboglobus sp. PH5-10]|uniref:hypothetical protein n=1 Tax=Ereboglobus sp. PH5-10 TaxID=2940629 RepID=UPI002405459C|nr:hypothetical protein [Ereboglobus sp. PH5-10]MDF9827047.1 hypothetical protein [Ereboglobus sp. PH5-10]